MRMAGDVQRVAILGASGYGGGELLRLLAAHPGAEVTFLGAKDSAGRTLAEVHPHLASLPLAATALAADRARRDRGRGRRGLQRPPERHERGARARAARGGRARDRPRRGLPAAGRGVSRVVRVRPPGEGAGSRRRSTGCPSCSAIATPGAQLVANPGCYPTPVILGLAPLLAAGLVEPGAIRVDGKTGLSGAGKSANDATIYNATEESVRPYRVPAHQHTPEMERGLELATGLTPSVLFVPHLVPTVRGVLTTSYATPRRGRDDRVADGVPRGRVRRRAVRAGAPAGRDGRLEAHPRHERRGAAGGGRPADGHGRRRRAPSTTS